MENLIIYLSEYFEQTVSLLWLPLLVWTAISALVWIVLNRFESIHPVYHYHTRLALLLSLPAGFLFLAGIHAAEVYMLSQQATETSLRIISVMSPVEMTIIPADTESTITLLQAGYAAIVFLFIAGVLLSVVRFFTQWVRLHHLRKNCACTETPHIEHLDEKNRTLISSIRKRVKIAFVDADIIPVTFGYRNPIILLPQSIRNHPENMNLALRHELSHITQNDFLSQVMAAFTQALFWFHPLVHRLKREIIEYRELRCDMLVLAEASVSRKKYASLLLELLPKPNLQQELSVNMAQESSNLKKRIRMITQHKSTITIPKRSSLAIFGALFLSTVIVMACTDMQTHDVYDNEELDLMTDVDQTGERGYHQIIIFLSEEEQAARHEGRLSQLSNLQPEHITSLEILKDQAAIDRFGERGEKGVIIVNTNLSPESYNTVLQTMGLESQDITVDNLEDPEDYFVVVEDMPELIGGLASLQQQIRYPEMARRAGIEGRVFVQFIINEQGEVERPRVIRGIGAGADEEALRVVSQARFTPGMQRGQPVRVQYSLPIFFRLAGSDSTPEQTSIEPRENMFNEINVVGYGGTENEVRSIEPELIGREMRLEIFHLENGIRGRVMDDESGEPLVGASVSIAGTNRGAATNLEGYFELRGIESNEYTLEFSFVGYRSATMTASR